MHKIFFKDKFLVLFLCTMMTSCALVEKTRRHLLGEDKRSTAAPPAHGTNAEQQQTPVNIGNNQPTGEGSGVVVTAVEEKVADPTVPELANPNTVWVFDNSSNLDSNATNDLATLKTALELYSTKQWDASMGQLRRLVQSNNDQVQVRARYYAGKILQYKNKHQLALQVFEQIIQQNGYSSLAMLAVKEAVVSAKMSQLKDKEIFYQTSLDDLAKQVATP